MTEPSSIERHAKTLRAWHLSLLRFALTLEEPDRQQVVAAAREIDRIGLSSGGGRQDFRYFRTLSEELCRAMAEQDNTPSSPLYSYIAKIEDARIRRAFAAVLSIDIGSKPVSKPATSRDMLWRGLSPRGAPDKARELRHR